MTIEKDIARFENIGDNCEFGFVKRALGNEDGGLLRWTVSPPRALIAAMADHFQSLYRFENLTPSWDDMLTDSAYGFSFHTSMKSREKVWVNDLPERQELYREELGKIHYLVDKLLRRAADPANVFVYKHNAGLTPQTERDILHALRQLGPAHLLVIRTTDDPSRIGTVEPAEGYLVGYLDTLADYAKSDQFSKAWYAVVENTIRQISPQT